MKIHAIADDEYHDLDGALRLGGATWGSPINEGFSVLHAVVFNRSKLIDGPDATQEDDGEVWLKEPWSGADRALGDAALAKGAPDLLSDADRALLLQAWRAVFER